MSGKDETEAVKKEETDPEAPKEEEKPRKEWLKRGELLGLCVAAGMVIWMQAIPLLAMLGHSAVNTGHWFPCEAGGNYDLSAVDSLLCGWTQGFTCSFAPFALTVMNLFIGRDLLQKRLYYGILRKNGVLQFASNNPLTDPLSLLVLVAYVHVILYLIFIIYATGLLSSDDSAFLLQHGRGVIGGSGDTDHLKETLLARDSYAMRAVMELISFYVLPATLFIVFFFCGYDIEFSLVPLSQYVHDEIEAGEKDSLSKLSILQDSHAKHIVEEHGADILALAGDHEDEFVQMLEQYKQKDTPEALGTVYMFDGLWPAYILLPNEASQCRSAKLFRWLFLVYAICAVFCCLLAASLCLQEVEEYLHKATQGYVCYTVELVVIGLITAVVFAVIGKLIVTTWKARGLKIDRKKQ
jgi:hypothetical protein